MSQVVTYVNRTSESLSSLLFVVEPNRQPDVFHLNDLSWADGRPVEGYALEGPKLRVPLPDPLLPGTSARLLISFELDLPAEAGPFGYTAHQTNFGDWYPFVPPYRVDEGWLMHAPASVGEHLVYDVADYLVAIELAGSRTDLTIAANVPTTTKEDRHRYQIQAARGFVWSVSPEYTVLTETADAVTVVGYVFPEHIAAGRAAVSATAEALKLYSGSFGAYPHSSLAVVEADFPDGMEYDGLYFLGQEYYAAYAGNPKSYLTTIAVHETSHQWWYGLVGNDQALEPWLDETLATYSELLFYEAVHPDLIDWWWRFRVTRFEPTGWVDSTIYDHSGFRPYVNAVYLRGALFMEELRNLIGDRAFFDFLQDYATRNAHNQATSGNFFSSLAEHTSSDVRPLVSAYFSTRERR